MRRHPEWHGLTKSEQAFWSHVGIGRDDDCWIWLAAYCGPAGQRRGAYKGYAVKPRYAHRIAWELHNKKRIPQGILIRHSCDNGMCCNPKHLSLGTHLDNSRDKIERGRAAWQGGVVSKAF